MQREQLGRDPISLIWLGLALVVALAHQWIPDATWLMIHLVLLGALTHAIMVWSRHFTQTLLRVRPDEAEHRRHRIRLWLQTIGATIVLGFVPFSTWHGAALGAAIVAVAVVWHGIDLWRDLRHALPSRFRVSIWYYLVAAAWLPVAVTFGVLLATGPSTVWFGRLLISHISTAVLGWILFTLVGTLITFWPTMLRARMDDRAEGLAKQALAWLVAGVVLTVTGALGGDDTSILIGLGVYVFGLLWAGRALFAPLRRKPPREFAPASVGLALLWLIVSLVWIIVMVATQGWEAFDSGPGRVAGAVAVGFGVQLLTGALSYLIPSVLGGGPSAVRVGQAMFNKFATSRLVIINACLIIWLCPTPPWVRVAVSSFALLPLGAFLVLAILGIRAQLKYQAAPTQPTGPREHQGMVKPVWTRRGLLLGGGSVALVSAAGVAVDPEAAGLPPWPYLPPGVEATGETTTIEVYTKEMRFHPETVDVPLGNMLRVELVNNDPVDTHDLRIGNDQTPRIDPGESTSLEFGPVAESIQGYCTVVGHRQMGMVFDVVAIEA